MTDSARIPLFPLGTALFPKAACRCASSSRATGA